MSMSIHAFGKMIRQIEAQGYDRDTAGRLAALIGDTPCQDEQGRLVVEDEKGEVLARLQWLEIFGGERK